MRESETARQQRLAYEKVLYTYSTALEQGDFDTIIAILHQAENDPALEHMLIEMHQQGYQQEESLMNTENPITPPYASPVPAFTPERKHKPRRRWLIALESIAAAVIVASLILGAILLFSSSNRSHGSQVGSGKQQATKTISKQSGDIVAIVTKIDTSNKMQAATLTVLDAHTGTTLWTYEFLKDTWLDNKQIDLIIQDHVIYLASNRQVQALRVSDHKLLWMTTLGTVDEKLIFGDTPLLFVMDQGRLYASGYSDGNLYTLDPATGRILWHYNSSSQAALLAVNNGKAYVNSGVNGIQALDGKDGQVLWSFEAQTPPIEGTVAGNVLYVQATHSSMNDPNGMHKEEKPLLAINIATGKNIWSVIAPANGPSELVVAQEVVVLFDGNHFCGYHIKDGTLAWCTTSPTNGPLGEALTSMDGIVYGLYRSDFDTKTLLAINPGNGKVYWSKTQSPAMGYLHVIAFGNEIILPESHLILNRTTGEVLKTFLSSDHTIMTGAAGR